jgi:hypothetical protein
MFTSIFFIVEDDRLDQDSPFFFVFVFFFVSAVSGLPIPLEDLIGGSGGAAAGCT